MSFFSQTVTWIKVPPPSFDLGSVVLGSLGLAGVCALVALLLGTAFGVGTIVRRRRHPRRSVVEEGLHLF